MEASQTWPFRFKNLFGLQAKVWRPDNSPLTPGLKGSIPVDLVYLLSPRPSQLLKGIDRIGYLLRDSTIFQESIQESSFLIRDRLGWSLEELLSDGSTSANQPEDRLEPAMTAVQIGLCDLLSSYGIVPSAVLAMSGGEFAAAYASGALPRSSAMELACAWSRALSEQVGTGSMLTVRLDSGDAMVIASQGNAPVFLACDLSPEVSCISTTTENADTVIDIFTRRGVKAYAMPYSAGYHSELMHGWKPYAKSVMAKIGNGIPRIAYYSGVTGGRVYTLDMLHWYNVIAGTAFFQGATQSALNDSFKTFLEVNAIENLCGQLEVIAKLKHKSIIASPLVPELLGNL